MPIQSLAERAWLMNIGRVRSVFAFLCSVALVGACTTFGSSGDDKRPDAGPATTPTGSPSSSAASSSGSSGQRPPEDAGACTRDNGLGDTFQSCDPKGSHTPLTALAACEAWKKSHGDLSVSCDVMVDGPCSQEAVVALTVPSPEDPAGKALAIWAFGGPGAGHAALGSTCPTAERSLWGY